MTSKLDILYNKKEIDEKIQKWKNEIFPLYINDFCVKRIEKRSSVKIVEKAYNRISKFICNKLEDLENYDYYICVLKKNHDGKCSHCVKIPEEPNSRKR